MQAKTLNLGWRTIQPIIVKVLIAWLQVDSFFMEKEEITDVKLLVEHIRNAIGGCKLQ